MRARWTRRRGESPRAPGRHLRGVTHARCGTCAPAHAPSRKNGAWRLFEFLCTLVWEHTTVHTCTSNCISFQVFSFPKLCSKINRNGITAVWQRTVSGGQIKFGINEENRLIRNFEQGLSKEKRDSFRDVLSVIASSFPIEAIHTDYSDNPNSLVQAETDPEKILHIENS